MDSLFSKPCGQLVSVIIPTYNSSKFLSAAIDSVLSQTYSEIEIVVVDDGSSDDPQSVCDRYPNVTYIYQDNQGVSVARNAGAQASRGRYLLFLDSDDRLLPEAVEIGLAAMAARPDAGFVFGRYLYKLINADGSETIADTFEGQPSMADYATILADRHRIQCACVLLKREVFEAVGGFDRTLWALEDLHLFLRIAREFPIYFHDRLVSEYRINDRNVSSESVAMLVGSLDAHRRQLSYVKSSGKPEHLTAYAVCERIWIKLFGDRILYKTLQLTQEGKWVVALAMVRLLLQYDPDLKIVDREVAQAVAESLGGVALSSQLQTTVSDLTVFFQRNWAGEWVYNSVLFNASNLDRLNDYFDRLVLRIGARSRTATAASAVDGRELVQKWQTSGFRRADATRTSFPQTQCPHQLFEAQVDRTPDAIAVTYGEDRLTYRELNERANRLAHRLQSLGVKAETLVGLSVERSLEMVVGILGILKAGGAYVPLDPTYPQDRLAYMLEDSQVPVLVTMERLAGSFGDYSGTVVGIDGNLSQYPIHNPVSEVSPDNLIYIIYTSGSTGKPKGVQVTHANVGRLFAATEDWYRFGASDVWTLFHSYAFDFSVWELWGALIYGGKLVVVPFEISRSPQDFCELLAKEKVTVLNQTPSAFRQLIRVAVDNSTKEFSQSAQLALRWVIFGGEALDLYSLKPWFELFGDKTPQLVNMYGITETTVHVTYRPIDSSDLAGGSVIGEPIPDLELYILDPETRQPLEIGIAGEMYVGGAGVARGYLNRPDLTADRFIAHPFRPESGERLYKTGDLARYLANGDIEYLGRIDNQVKIRGFRIELGEIEAAISGQLAVREVAVIVREDEPGDLRLVAYVVPASDAPLDIVAMRAALAGQLPDYMVPVAFVRMETMPLTANGKLDRKALPAPDAASFGVAATVVGADNAIEQTLTEIWQEILKLDRVGVEDNFFNLGGNSLLGLRVLAQIKERLDVTVSPVRLYQYFTIRSLAGYLTPLLTVTTEKVASNSDCQPSNNLPEVDTSGIAVIGMVGRFPGANSIEELWENLRAGQEAITFFSEDEIDPSVDRELIRDPHYVPAKGVIAGAELFDAGFFGMSAKEAEVMDPQARIFVELAYQALETAGYIATDNNRIGVYAGSADNTYFEKHLLGSEAVDRFGELQTHLVNDRDYLTTRASFKLNLKGPSINISTACSTSLVAIVQACQDLLTDRCNLALAGGIAINTPQNQGYLHQEGSILTPDGHCRPFDANAQGTMFNSGAGIVVLKRLKDALADGDRIYSVIKGVGINNDGADKASFMAPSVSGQMGAIVQAQQMAGFNPATITYVEAHGTATNLGDPIEVEALTQAFRIQTEAKQFCGIGSIKSNFGHLTAAAGVAGFIKTVLALYHRQIPPSINYSSPNPYIDFANSPFYVNDRLVDWQAGETPRRAGVSSFGGGGTNAHVVLEEPPELAKSGNSRPYQLLLLSGKTERAIESQTTNLQAHLQNQTDLNLADVAYTLQQGRNRYDRRRFIVAADAKQAIDRLATLPPNFTATRQTPSKPPTVVFAFPGQGSQYANMGRGLYESEPVFKDAIDECAHILQPIIDLDLRELLYPAADKTATSTELLNQTRYTQPALFTVEYALSQLWQSWGIKPQAAIGHSVGEIVAAQLAGVFSLPDALKLVAARGKLMWELPAGSMLSVRLAAEAVESRLPDGLAIAAINSPTLCVVSGATEAIERFRQELEREEIGCKLLHTSHAFHSPMMAPIVAPFRDLVATLQLSPPSIPFISATGNWITAQQATSPQYWADRLVAPVRFAEGVQNLWQSENNYVLLEVGSRQALTTLARQQITDRQRQFAIPSLENTAADNTDWQFMLQAIGQLWLLGIEIDWHQFYANETRHRLPLPTYPFDRQKYWIDPRPHPSNTVTTHPSLPPAPMPEPTPATPEPRAVRLQPEIAAVIQDTAGVSIGAGDSPTGTLCERQATFLELGLDSLALTQVALSLKKKFKVKVTFRQLLEDCATLETLARSIDLQLPPDAFPAPVVAAATPPTVEPVSIALSPVLAAPVPSNPQPPSPVAMPVVSPVAGSALESVVQQQLQLMAQQLALLGGTPVTPAPIVPPTVNNVPLATSSNGNGNNVHSNGNGHINGNGNGKAAPTNGNGKTAPAPMSKAPAAGVKINKAIDTSLSPTQQQALARIIDRYVARTKESKRQAQEHRRYLADPRTVSGFSPLLKEMVYPIVTNRAQGSRLWDEDGNEYIDLTNGFGLNFFGWSPDFVTEAVKAQLDKGIEIGPQTALAGKVAKKIAAMTGMERVTFCNTGSEAVMAAFRIARTVSGRDRVVLFANSYHGAFDEVLVRAGFDLKTFPAAPGVMANDNILVLDYGDPAALEIIRQQADEIAAVIVEPVQSRYPNLQPRDFLHQLRRITQELEIALIFDEVVNGFRVAPGGAQEYFGIRADIATYGKVVGGGLPIGILTGSAQYLDALDGGYWEFGDDSMPTVGVTFFAGTFVRHPLALAAADAVLDRLKAGGAQLQREVANRTQKLAGELIAHCKLVGAPIQIETFSSWFYITFPPSEPYGGLLFYLLRERGIHVWEYRPCFLTLAHTDADLDTILWAFKVSIAELQTAGFLASSPQAVVINRNLPPQPGAKLGKDREGNPAWFIPDPDAIDRYLQLDVVV